MVCLLHTEHAGNAAPATQRACLWCSYYTHSMLEMLLLLHKEHVYGVLITHTACWKCCSCYTKINEVLFLLDTKQSAGASLHLVGAFWPLVFASWPLVGASWPFAWPIVGAPWPLAGASWPLVGASWPLVGASWPFALPFVGASWPLDGASWPLVAAS